jgi:hypothetical protein
MRAKKIEKEGKINAKLAKPAKGVKKVQAKAEPPAQPVNFSALDQQKRVSNMFRDMEKYALVDFVNTPAKVTFKLINVRDNKNLLISAKDKKTISCSCMDWKMRGSKSGMNCKHILYVVSQILKLEYKVSEFNKISNFDVFEGAFARIKINFNAGLKVAEDFKMREDRELTEEDLCPICFTDFLSGERDNVVNCLRCRGLVHGDCMVCWVRNAVNKSCVYCGDKEITKGLKF